MPDDAPRIAFAVPVYNGARYLPEALAALQAQTETRWVAVVTDNASTDDTAAIVRRASVEDPPSYTACTRRRRGGGGQELLYDR